MRAPAALVAAGGSDAKAAELAAKMARIQAEREALKAKVAETKRQAELAKAQQEHLAADAIEQETKAERARQLLDASVRKARMEGTAPAEIKLVESLLGKAGAGQLDQDLLDSAVARQMMAAARHALGSARSVGSDTGQQAWCDPHQMVPLLKAVDEIVRRLDDVGIGGRSEPMVRVGCVQSDESGV